jgi:hypothetical protein
MEALYYGLRRHATISRRMRWVGHVKSMGTEKPEGKRPVQYL